MIVDRGSMRRPIAVLLACVLLTVALVAGAQLTDQVWLSGIYDAGDDDDVALLASSLDGVAAGAGRASEAPAAVIGSCLPAPICDARTTGTLLSTPPRAPPPQ